MAMKEWIAPEGARIPDFIICGAMKSGTSTLHYILNEHPHIYIPDNEIHFFDIDNILQHPDFNYFDGNNWSTQRLEDDPQTFWTWYSAQFEGAAPEHVVGEDSTTYLASEVAARRIRLQNKKIKLIIMLRHPTIRAYSHYWHMVRTGRAIYNFEDTLRFDPLNVLHKSLYLEQLRSFHKHIPKEQIMTVIFEEFVTDMSGTLRDICGHINVDYTLLPLDLAGSHKNKGAVPKYPAVQILKNRFFRGGGNLAYMSYLPMRPALLTNKRFEVSFYDLMNRIHGKLNPSLDTNHHKIKPSTKEFLDEFFRKELDGINDLLEKDVMSIWFE